MRTNVQMSTGQWQWQRSEGGAGGRWSGSTGHTHGSHTEAGGGTSMPFPEKVDRHADREIERPARSVKVG